jgi:hypothetical protein
MNDDTDRGPGVNTYDRRRDYTVEMALTKDDFDETPIWKLSREDKAMNGLKVFQFVEERI